MIVKMPDVGVPARADPVIDRLPELVPHMTVATKENVDPMSVGEKVAVSAIPVSV